LGSAASPLRDIESGAWWLPTLGGRAGSGIRTWFEVSISEPFATRKYGANSRGWKRPKPSAMFLGAEQAAFRI